MTSVGLLLLRLVAGGTLMVHGYPKLFGGPGQKAPEPMAKLLGSNYPAAVEAGGPKAFAQNLERMGVPQPELAAYLSGLAEFGGGLLLAVGAFTGIASAAVIFNMAVAVQKVHWKVGFYGQGGYEFPALLAAAVATIGLSGPGALSLSGSRARR
ncbi:MAG: DoxX family protein [Candidatus Dormibacteraeota bacterium]|uniref:DoxX family protein n=1 Tax=Candidatus Dormiibacter inghamiae TaxID=3127013 RepID=A0A934KBY6_9BACT|nr:DoxX family protein [Candidatus Dormibacteraeota bacterium]MBJ7605398.1 DoxX family protein [Candidatus Dormibacteraeota bacterium]